MRPGDLVKVEGRRGTFVIKSFDEEKGYFNLFDTEKNASHAAYPDKLKHTTEQKKLDRLAVRAAKNTAVQQFFTFGRSLGLKPSSIGERLHRAIDEGE